MNILKMNLLKLISLISIVAAVVATNVFVFQYYQATDFAPSTNSEQRTDY